MNNKYLSYIKTIFVITFLFVFSSLSFAQKNTDGTPRAMPSDPRNFGWWEDPRLNRGSRTITSPPIPANSTTYAKSKNKAKDVKDALKSANTFLKQGSGSYYAALDWFLYAASLDAKSVDAYIGLGKTYNKLKRYADAVAAFNQALHLKSNAVEAMVGLSETHYRQKEFDKTIELCQQTLKLEPASVAAYLLLGNVYFARKQYTEAITAYKNAVALESKSVEAHYNLAVTHLMTKNDAAAIEEQKILQGLNENAAKMLDAWIDRKANQ